MATRKKAEYKLTKRSRQLTGATLKLFGACPSQRRKFTRLFGKSVNVTVKRVVTAAAKGLEVAYLYNLMSPVAEAAYEKAANKLWRTGGYAKAETALNRKHKRNTEQWHTDYELRSSYYEAYDKNYAAFEAECDKLRALYWINDPEPVTKPPFMA